MGKLLTFTGQVVGGRNLHWLHGHLDACRATKVRESNPPPGRAEVARPGGGRRRITAERAET